MKRLSALILFAVAFAMASCDIFSLDDGFDGKLTRDGGFFYMIDRTPADLLMLDAQLNELERWNLYEAVGDSSLQGITFDGELLWVSSAGSSNSISRISLYGDSIQVVTQFPSPPNGSGIIRDLAWDGTYLWAVNSGSRTLGIPPRIYQLNPDNGEILAEYNVPTAEPRAFTYIPPNSDPYGRSAPEGFYYGDPSTNLFHYMSPDRKLFDVAFDAPEPPESSFRIFPTGITHELDANNGIFFWTVNSSLESDYLFRLNREGRILDRFELPYRSPGALVLTQVDVREAPAPIVESVLPNRALPGERLMVTLNGQFFREVGPGDISVDMGRDITVEQVFVVSQEVLEVRVQIDPAAAIGSRDITVTNADGTQATFSGMFLVVDRLPDTLLRIGWSTNYLYQTFADDGTGAREWDTDVVATAGSPQGVAFDGENVWLSAAGDDRRIYKISLDGPVLSEVRSIPAPYPRGSGTVRDMTWHNGSLWVVNSSDQAVYEVNPANGSIQQTILTGTADPRSVTFVDGVMHTTDRETRSVYRHEYNIITDTWSTETVFQVPPPPGATEEQTRPTGIAWDGEAFWINNALSRASTLDYTMRVSPDGELLDAFLSPRAGEDLLNGLEYLPAGEEVN